MRNFDFSRLTDLSYIVERDVGADYSFVLESYILAGITFLIGLLIIVVLARKFEENKPKYELVSRTGFVQIVISAYFALSILIRTSGGVVYSRLFMYLSLTLEILLIIYVPLYVLLLLPKRIERYEKARQRVKYKSRKK
jgi:hypothetical protein